MKKTHSVQTASEPAKPTQENTPWQEDQEQLPAESLNLTPQRISQGASTTTEVLVGILAQKEHTREFRNWGINE
jgi:hypothetical protein